MALTLALALVLAAISAPWFRIPSDNADGAGMRAHLHALFEGRDLLYDDEYAQLRMSPLFAFVTETGWVSNHWPIGASFVQAPGWLLGRAAGELLHRRDADAGARVSERAATWEIPLLGLRTWALLVMLAALAASHRMLATRVGARTAGLATAATALGTPLLYYAAEAPERPHLWGFAAVTALTLRWLAATEHARAAPEQARARPWAAVELAVYAGLATAIRPQLAMLAALVAHERFVASRGLAPGPRVALLVRHGALGAAAFVVWPLLVVAMQRWMYGGLSDYEGEVTHHLQAFLLSTHHGALVWCPVLVIGLLGLAIGVARREPGAAVIVAIVAAQVWLDAGTREIEPYTVLGTRTWAGGTSFGPRKLLDVAPLLLPGVIWIQRWLAEQGEGERRRWQRRLTAATGLAIIPTVLLLAAAWLDPRVCSDVLDGERLLIAMAVPFDVDAWAAMAERRALAGRVTATVAGVVGLPLALALLAGLGREAAPSRTPSHERSRRAWLAVLAYGLAANLWLAWLHQRTAALVEADPARIEAARAQLNPWHEALVREIPRQQALLRERLGPGV